MKLTRTIIATIALLLTACGKSQFAGQTATMGSKSSQQEVLTEQEQPVIRSTANCSPVSMIELDPRRLDMESPVGQAKLSISNLVVSKESTTKIHVSFDFKNELTVASTFKLHMGIQIPTHQVGTSGSSATGSSLLDAQYQAPLADNSIMTFAPGESRHYELTLSGNTYSDSYVDPFWFQATTRTTVSGMKCMQPSL